MDDGSPGGPVRLRGAGVGSVIGGLTLAILSFTIPYTLAAAATMGIGIVAWMTDRQTSGGGIGIGLGCAAVGVIGLVEAFGLGLGLDPLFLAAIAVGAGAIDILVGGVLNRFKSGN